jgi:hypothetical protein
MSYGATLPTTSDAPPISSKNFEGKQTADLPVEQPKKREFIVNLKRQANRPDDSAISAVPCG